MQEARCDPKPPRIPGLTHWLPDYFLVVSVTVVPGYLFAYFLVTNLPVFALLWILRGEPFFAMSPSSYVWIHRIGMILVTENLEYGHGIRYNVG